MVGDAAGVLRDMATRTAALRLSERDEKIETG